MPYVTPRTWVAGDVLTAAQLNVDVRDNVSFLGNPPACRVFHNASISIPNAVETVLPFNSERFDTDAMHDNATNNTRITFTSAGLYLVTLHFEFVSNGVGYRYGALRLGGTVNIAFESKNSESVLSGAGFSIATAYKFTAAQYVTAHVYQNSGAALSVSSGGDPYTAEMSATRLGTG